MQSSSLVSDVFPLILRFCDFRKTNTVCKRWYEITTIEFYSTYLYLNRRWLFYHINEIPQYSFYRLYDYNFKIFAIDNKVNMIVQNLNISPYFNAFKQIALFENNDHIINNLQYMQFITHGDVITFSNIIFKEDGPFTEKEKSILYEMLTDHTPSTNPDDVPHIYLNKIKRINQLCTLLLTDETFNNLYETLDSQQKFHIANNINIDKNFIHMFVDMSALFEMRNMRIKISPKLSRYINRFMKKKYSTIEKIDIIDMAIMVMYLPFRIVRHKWWFRFIKDYRHNMSDYKQFPIKIYDKFFCLL